MVATGFPPERVPGYALPVPTLPAAAQVLARHHPDAWPEIEGALAEAMPGQALAAWLRQAGHRPAGTGDESLLAGAAQTVEATAAWEAARLQAPGLVITGDELTYGQASLLAAQRWLIAGTGGSSYTSAELILDANPDAEVVMVGIGAREPVRNIPLYTSLTRAHVAAHGGDGRLTVVDGQPLLGQIQTAQRAGRPIFRVRGYEGDACVACLGRAGILPAAVNPLAGWAYRQRGQVAGELMYDDGQYLGYRLQFAAAGERYAVEITGAASRALPTELFPADILRRVAREWQHETPPETGNVPGGYVATAVQAHRYHQARTPAWRNDFPGGFAAVPQPPAGGPAREPAAGRARVWGPAEAVPQADEIGGRLRHRDGDNYIVRISVHGGPAISRPLPGASPAPWPPLMMADGTIPHDRRAAMTATTNPRRDTQGPLAARSAREIQLYLDLHPCECGAARPRDSQELRDGGDGGFTSVYAGTCPGCGHQWSVSFGLPASPPPAGRIGGAEPSAIIDPGEWLLLSDQDADVPASAGLLSPEDRAQLGRAADELGEVASPSPLGVIASLTARSLPAWGAPCTTDSPAAS